MAQAAGPRHGRWGSAVLAAPPDHAPNASAADFIPSAALCHQRRLLPPPGTRAAVGARAGCPPPPKGVLAIVLFAATAKVAAFCPSAAAPNVFGPCAAKIQVLNGVAGVNGAGGPPPAPLQADTPPLAPPRTIGFAPPGPVLSQLANTEAAPFLFSADAAAVSPPKGVPGSAATGAIPKWPIVAGALPLAPPGVSRPALFPCRPSPRSCGR